MCCCSINPMDIFHHVNYTTNQPEARANDFGTLPSSGERNPTFSEKKFSAIFFKLID